MKTEKQSSAVPLGYVLVKLLFKILLKVFYKDIIIENEHFIPENGHPCIVCSNHGNSITDAVLLVGATPKRDMLRLTAKSTLFGRKTITSFVMESAGAVPIKRRKDHDPGSAVDNSGSMATIKKVLERGDAVCLFPEGASRFHPSLAPLKSGVAWLISDLLARNKDNPDFRVSVSLCSVNYMCRRAFRSDVVMTFQPPLTFSAQNYNATNDSSVASIAVQAITDRLRAQLVSGLLDAPNWAVIRSAKLSAKFYVASRLPKRMAPGDIVRVTQAFLEAFKKVDEYDSASRMSDIDDVELEMIRSLRRDLDTHQNDLSILNVPSTILIPFISSYPIPLPLAPSTKIPIFPLIRPFILSPLAIPGLLTFWGPTFLIVNFAVSRFLLAGGTVEDTHDEIAHVKILTGLICGIWGAVALGCAAAYVYFWHGFPGWWAPAILIGVPALQWWTLRLLEEVAVAYKALLALSRFRMLKEPVLSELQVRNERLVNDVSNVAATLHISESLKCDNELPAASLSTNKQLL